MADRILNWWIDQPVPDGTAQGPAHCLDRDYIPRALRFHVGKIPDGGVLEFDIRAAGVSLFSRAPTLFKGLSDEDWWEDFKDPAPVLEKYSWVSLHMVTTGGAKQISVQLELDEQLPEAEDEVDKEDI